MVPSLVRFPRFVALAAVGSGCAALVLLFAATLSPPLRVSATTALAQDSFAVCTVPLSNDGHEAFFVLDFETGDLTGTVMSPNTSRFASGYRYNVLKDLEFKPGKVKNPKFLLVPGLVPTGAAVGGQGASQRAPSVLYVTDAATGVTVAYGIPWNSQQGGAAAGPPMQELVPLDILRPRGGGAKVR